MRTDIKQNDAPIIFTDDIFLDKLKVPSIHSPNHKAIFINSITGELYAATSEGGGGNTEPYAAPFNQKMQAILTTYNHELATYETLTKQSLGRIDVYVNGVKEPTGFTQSCYFSNDGGVTARTSGEEILGDELYWNGLIAGYELDPTDYIDFDYLAINPSSTPNPQLNLVVSGGSWGNYSIGSYVLDNTTYNVAPLESWTFYDTINSKIELITSETLTDLINIATITINGNTQSFTIINTLPIDPHDKKIVDGLFKSYTYGGVIITLSRGTNWPSFIL